MPSAQPSAAPRPNRAAAALPAELLAILRCPVSGSTLRQDGDQLVSTTDPSLRYPIERGVPKLLAPR
ncbi:hypothetical protein [Nesterenkonia jeotgali]|uniref:Uncharacterized protein YbaR (Trm112 family) n=1 Tax=Nesterenkonia jeotgali TaxID=317018 RepID=A0A0W8IJS0_9MICC|nr:hypothetical protein [Nesterenkonia jeotgali]KUG60319.1 hypothetical protein AVL63_07885 [Nesterenkonia jeotgali]MBA8920181.1 uncharacterized protein YbaR (Trm112 family) [Nesterenkonia jeotgali]